MVLKAGQTYVLRHDSKHTSPSLFYLRTLIRSEVIEGQTQASPSQRSRLPHTDSFVYYCSVMRAIIQQHPMSFHEHLEHIHQKALWHFPLASCIRLCALCHPWWEHSQNRNQIARRTTDSQSLHNLSILQTLVQDVLNHCCRAEVQILTVSL